MTLSGPSLPPRSGAPRQLVLILHGWGADGANLIDLGEAFSSVLPDAMFIAPNAPEVCEVNPYGYQWFSLMDRTPQVMWDGLTRAAKILNQFIDKQLSDLKLDESKLALVGFSQGTMTALHVALRRERPVACVVGFSGALLGPEVLPGEIKARPPVCLIHGEMDTVVPFASLAQAERVLKSSGVAVETHARPGLPHSIDLEGIEMAKQFLVRHLSAITV